jgi:hypothetical protein
MNSKSGKVKIIAVKIIKSFYMILTQIILTNSFGVFVFELVNSMIK